MDACAAQVHLPGGSLWSSRVCDLPTRVAKGHPWQFTAAGPEPGPTEGSSSKQLQEA